MPQNPPNITESPEFKEFCKKNNLEVFNQEAINVILFQQQEMINEIAEHTRLPDFIDEEGQTWMGGRLIDKWNKNGK